MYNYKKTCIVLSIFASLFLSAYMISCSKPATTPPAPTCADKTIVVSAITTPTSGSTSTNGTLTASAVGSTGFTYSLNNGTFQSSGTFSNLAAGSYNLTAKDDAGCTASKTFTITAPACPTILATGVATQTAGPTATNGTVTATATGGIAPYTYSKDGTTFQGSNVFSGLLAGAYTITAKDANACIGTSSSITVLSAACPTIAISNVIVGSELCSPSNVGSIAVTASGSTGFTYNINGGAFQTSNVFANLIANNYIIGVKDANGCVNTSNAAVSNLPQGPLFTSLKAVLATNCAFAGCHGGASPQSGINYADNCTIVSGKVRINARAVVAGTMPPSGAMSAADKQKITDWINAGGKYSN